MNKLFILITLSFALTSTLAKAQSSGITLDYDGINDYTTIKTYGILSGVTSDFTVEAWVYWRGGAAFQRIFDFGTGANSPPINDDWIFLTPSTGSVARFAISNNGLTSPQVLDAAIPLPTNVWTHVAVTINAANAATIYINGVASGTATITLNPSDLGYLIENFFGRSQFAVDPYFNGRIDEFRFSNISRYAGNFTPQQNQFSSDANTVLLFHFNEGLGQTTADASSNSFNAVLGANNGVEPNDPLWVNGSILPITLIDFAVQKEGNKADLKWKVVSSVSGGAFIIERSENGSGFHQIGNVIISAVSGNSNYSFLDNSPFKGRNYYRIKIMERNALAKYSSVAIADFSGKLYSAYPTLTSSQIFVSIPKRTQVAIYNNNGALVKMIQLETSQNIDVKDLKNGVYQLFFEGSKETVRFIKM